MTDIREIILTIPVFLLAISIHEYAHAQVAVSLGDPTPKLQGRLTLNFMSHFSWLGALFLLIAGIGWAKPVQISTRNLKNPTAGLFWISLAGPLANLALAIVLALALKAVGPFLPRSVVGQAVGLMLLYGARLNILLMFFNLIPVPPLDGSKVVMPFLPTRWAYALERAEPWGFLIIYVLVRFMGFDRLLFSATYSTLGLLLS
jgi:Zn-dependent protease